MKYSIIATISILFLAYLWAMDPIESKFKHFSQVDSTAKVTLDTVSITFSPAPPPPQIVYYPEPKTDLLSMSNEIITMVIGLGNIFMLYKQLNKKK